MIINVQSTKQVFSKVGFIESIQVDHFNNICVDFVEANPKNGKIPQGATRTHYKISAKDLGSGNWSVGDAFGAIASAARDQYGNFDLDRLQGKLVILFIHANESRTNGNIYYNVYDIYPIQLLQTSYFDDLKTNNNSDYDGGEQVG